MKINIQIILIWLLIFAVHPLFAQQTFQIKGIVQSSTGEPLLGANIQLTSYKNTSLKTGVATGKDGTFSLSTTKGTYKLEISYVGYTSYISNVEIKGNVNLPPITLSEDAKMMKTLVVTARSITYNTDGYISEVHKNPLFRNMNMTSVLKMSPGIYTTSSSVEIFGESVSHIYLNGRELKLGGEQLINYLETIHAQNVKEMEVITASGVEEDAANKGKSIIKITTFNPETGGLTNFSIGSANSKDKNMNTLSGNVNWRINPQWGTYVNISSAFGNNTTGNHSEIHFYDTDLKRISESTNKGKLNGNFRGVWGLTYDLDKDNLFSLEGTFQHNKRSTPSTSYIRNSTNHSYTDVATGNIDATRQYQKYNISFIYTHKFNRNAQLDFKADRMGTNIDDNSLQRYKYIKGDNTGYDHRNKERHLIHTARLDYTQRFKPLNGKFTTGAKGTWFSNKNHTDYTTYLNERQDYATSYTDLYRYQEDVYALYAKYAFTYRKLNIDFGARMEHTRIYPESSSNPERNKENHYTDLFPEISLNYIINKEKGHNINLGYNRGLGRPHMDYLNPLIRRTGEYSYSMGNPMLEAIYYNIYTLTTTLFNKYILNVRYNQSNDGILGMTENKDGILYSSYTTGFKRSWLTAHLDIPMKVKNWLDVKFYANYSFNQEHFQENDIYAHHFNAGYIATFRLPKNFRIENELSHGTINKGIYSKSSKPINCNISIYKSFPKQSLNCSLTFTDIFNSYGSARTDVFQNDFYQISRANYHGFGINFHINYSLRWGKKFMVRRSISGNMQEMTRIATE